MLSLLDLSITCVAPYTAGAVLYELACTVPVAPNRRGSHPSHSVPNTAILGVADATPYSIHISPRRRYIFEVGCNAETQKRRLNWA